MTWTHSILLTFHVWIMFTSDSDVRTSRPIREKQPPHGETHLWNALVWLDQSKVTRNSVSSNNNFFIPCFKGMCTCMQLTRNNKSSSFWGADCLSFFFPYFTKPLIRPYLNQHRNGNDCILRKAFSLTIEVFICLHWNFYFAYYPQTSNISCTLIRNKIIDQSDADGASPGGAAPTAS